MEELKTKKDFEKEAEEQARKEKQNNLQKELNKISALIDMRASNEINPQEYAKKRQESEEQKNYWEAQIKELGSKNKKLLAKADKTLSFATNLKNRFEKSSPEEKRSITLSLGSNLEILNKKAHFCLNLPLQPLAKHAKGAIREFERVKPLETRMNTMQNTPLRGACSVMSE